MGQRTVIGMKDPGYPDVRNNFLLRTAALRSLAIDDEGLMVDARLARCRYVYVTHSHQCPTTMTLALARRQKLLQYARGVNVRDSHRGNGILTTCQRQPRTVALAPSVCDDIWVGRDARPPAQG